MKPQTYSFFIKSRNISSVGKLYQRAPLFVVSKMSRYTVPGSCKEYGLMDETDSFPFFLLSDIMYIASLASVEVSI